MADSEVRQKFEAWADEYLGNDGYLLRDADRPTWKDDLSAAYSAGMRAGEIAMREKAAQALEDFKMQKLSENPPPNFTRIRDLADMIRALPAAPEEKKP